MLIIKNKNIAILFAILAAALYAINVPLSKSIMNASMPTVTAGLLYMGAGIGMLTLEASKKIVNKGNAKEHLTIGELPYTIAMVLLDIIAPILLMIGITKTSSANVSLLNNFEIVATSIIALVIFKEKISKKLWGAIALVTTAGIMLGFENSSGLSFDIGSLFVLGASVCWGFENNCTKMLSNKSSEQIVIIKGIFSGLGSLITALIIGESIPEAKIIIFTMLLGFVSYGLSINFYIMAQNKLGAAKTSAFYSVAPFLGVAFGMLIHGEKPDAKFFIAFAIMIFATVIMINDTVSSDSRDNKKG